MTSFSLTKRTQLDARRMCWSMVFWWTSYGTLLATVQGDVLVGLARVGLGWSAGVSDQLPASGFRVVRGGELVTPATLQQLRQLGQLIKGYSIPYVSKSSWIGSYLTEIGGNHW